MDWSEKPDETHAHRFLGHFQRRLATGTYIIYRCVCGYIEATPLNGGPSVALGARFEPVRDARRMALHLHLERAHQLN
ncbi:MAG TPA: hypothetical protein VMT61_01915 [Candidatus Binataceae bacterium]|nr:hypothetical protein [Candidatus Binataceae bacterium]